MSKSIAATADQVQLKEYIASSPEKDICENQDNKAIQTPSQGQSQHPNGDLSPLRWTSLVLCLAPGLMMALMDNTIVATSLFDISLQFNSLAGTYWVILAYLLTYLGFGALFARISDHVGRSWALVLAYGIFLAFSVSAGSASSLSSLIVFRTLQGLGGAGLYTLSFVIAIEISPEGKRFTIASAILGLTVSLAGVLGPIIGGLFSSYVTWRWIFWINGPISGFFMVVFILVSPSWLRQPRSKDAGRFDWLGSILLLAASILIIFALQEAGAQWDWSSAKVIVCLILGVVCCPVLFGWQWYIREKHIAAAWPWELVVDRITAGCLLNTILTGFVSFVAIFSIPLRYQIIYDKSPAWAGVHLLPLLAATGVGSIVGAATTSKRDLTLPVLLFGSTFLAIGSGLLSTLSSDNTVQGKTYGFQFILGLGVGLNLSAITVFTGKIRRPEYHAVLQGIVSQVRIFGGAIGVAISNVVFQGKARSQLRGILDATAIQDLQTSTKSLLQLSAAQIEAVRSTYNDAFRTSMQVCIGLSCAAFIASFLIRRNGLYRQSLQEQ